jgi:hypothetical protein
MGHVPKGFQYCTDDQHRKAARAGSSEPSCHPDCHRILWDRAATDSIRTKAPAIDQGQLAERSIRQFASLRSAFDALGPAHQNAKHGHDKQSQDYYKENFTYLDQISLSLGPPAVNKKKALAKPGPVSTTRNLSRRLSHLRHLLTHCYVVPLLASGLSLRSFRTIGSSSAAQANRCRRQLEAQGGGQHP